MKRSILFTILFVLFISGSTKAQLFKKIAEGIKDGAVGALDYTKNTISDAVEYGKAKSIYKKIKENKLTESEEDLKEFKIKYPYSNLSNYLSYLIYENDNFEYKNYDIAYDNINKAKEIDYLNFENKEKEKFCKDIGFCRDTLLKQFDGIQLKLLNFNKNVEITLSNFITKYPKSKYFDSAIQLRYQIRYEKAESANSLISYTEFISKNPQAPQVKIAKENLTILAFNKAEKENTIRAYDEFLNFFRDHEFLANRALTRIKYLKYAEINKSYIRIMNEFGDFINEFTIERTSDNGLRALDEDGLTNNYIVSKYAAQNSYSYENKKIVNTEINDGKQFYNAKKLFEPIENDIKDFLIEFPGSIESMNVQQIAKNITDTRERLDYYMITRYHPNEVAFERYINTHPGSIWKLVVENEKKIIENKQKRKEELANLREAERVKKEQAELQAKVNAENIEKTKAQQENNIMFQIGKRLNPVEKKLLLDILDGVVSTDPKGIVGNPCGTGYGSCKWCARSVTYQKTYTSKVQTLRMFAMMSPIANVMMPMVGLLQLYSSAISGANYSEKRMANDNGQIMNKYTAEVRSMLQSIRAGNYYDCDGNDNDLFCSRRCQYEYKNRR